MHLALKAICCIRANSCGIMGIYQLPCPPQYLWWQQTKTNFISLMSPCGLPLWALRFALPSLGFPAFLCGCSTVPLPGLCASCTCCMLADEDCSSFSWFPCILCDLNAVLLPVLCAPPRTCYMLADDEQLTVDLMIPLMFCNEDNLMLRHTSSQAPSRDSFGLRCTAALCP